MPKKYPSINTRFGNVITTSEPYRVNGRTKVLILCDCGNTKETNLQSLKIGDTKSCGCIKIQSIRTISVTHGLTKHPLYLRWIGLKERCYNENNPQYKDYGGRGITVYDGWLNNFKSFYDWAISNGWKKGLSIDRINNNGNYEPSNCRWATPKQQSRNRRSTVLTEQRVRHIRILYQYSNRSQRNIGSLYGVTGTNVRYIINNMIWQ